MGLKTPNPVPEHSWSARSVRPVVTLQVAAVFLAFMALAWFAFGSPGAVRALGLAAVGAVISTLPGILTRVEYRLTPEGLSKKRARPDADFQEAFSWEEVSHFAPTSSGFNFYKHMPPSNRLLGFLRRHVSDRYSGQIRVGGEDRARVRAIIDAHGLPVVRRRGRKRVRAGT